MAAAVDAAAVGADCLRVPPEVALGDLEFDVASAGLGKLVERLGV